jgi:hypothetical protein
LKLKNITYFGFLKIGTVIPDFFHFFNKKHESLQRNLSNWVTFGTLHGFMALAVSNNYLILKSQNTINGIIAIKSVGQFICQPG